MMGLIQVVVWLSFGAFGLLVMAYTAKLLERTSDEEETHLPKWLVYLLQLCVLVCTLIGITTIGKWIGGWL